MSQDEGDSKPLSSHEIEQAMAQVQNISAMLDSRTNPANVQAPASSQFPGLVEILPHLLAPLAEIQRTAASAMQQNQQRQRQSQQQQQQQGQQQQQQPGQQQQDQSQQPSSMLTYRPLVSQVQAVIAQLTSTSNDQSPGGGAQSVRLADEARQRRKAKTLTKEQKREAILDARRKRRERQQGQQQQPGQQQSQHQEQQPEQQVEQETEQKTQEAVGQGSGAANADSAMADETIAAESVQTTAAPQASTTPSLAS
ncbi:unnamed protein product [Jaminaea pallidilutea]